MASKRSSSQISALIMLELGMIMIFIFAFSAAENSDDQKTMTSVNKTVLATSAAKAKSLVDQLNISLDTPEQAAKIKYIKGLLEKLDGDITAAKKAAEDKGFNAPDSWTKLVKASIDLQELLRESAAKDKILDKLTSELQDVTEKLALMEKERDSLKFANDKAQEKLAALEKGKDGNTYASCLLINGSSRALYAVYNRPEGIVVTPAPYEDASEKALMVQWLKDNDAPLPIAFEGNQMTTLALSDFVSTFRALDQWAMDKSCKFYALHNVNSTYPEPVKSITAFDSVFFLQRRYSNINRVEKNYQAAKAAASENASKSGGPQ